MDELNLENAKKLRKDMDLFEPPVQTPFDHVCWIAMQFGKMLLDQHIAELKEAKRADTK